MMPSISHVFLVLGMRWFPLLGMCDLSIIRHGGRFDAIRELQRHDLVVANVPESPFSIPFTASLFDLPLQVSLGKSDPDADNGSWVNLIGRMNPGRGLDNQFDGLETQLTDSVITITHTNRPGAIKLDELLVPFCPGFSFKRACIGQSSLLETRQVII